MVTRRDWIALAGFVLTVVAVAATVAIVLGDRIKHPGSAPEQKRGLTLCYPNQGTGGC